MRPDRRSSAPHLGQARSQTGRSITWPRILCLCAAFAGGRNVSQVTCERALFRRTAFRIILVTSREDAMDRDKVRAFADKVYADTAGAMAAGMAYIGTKMGLFRSMAGKGPLSIEAVAKASGLQARYVEEWLKGMASAGYLDYEPESQTFALPEEHAYLLASEGSDHFMGGLFLFTPVLLSVAPKVAQAFKDGGGVSLSELGSDGIEALDWLNCGQYQKRFASLWLNSLPDVVERLQQGGRVLDVGCGVGRVSTAIAGAFPNAEVIGLDPDENSVTRARALASAAGGGGNLSFVSGTTRELAANGGFDLITACDCVHDFAAPQATLAEIRSLLKPDGALFVMEPKAADRLEDNKNALGTLYYGFSIFHCMTQSLAQGGPGLGTCLGPARTERLLREAGFKDFQRLDIRSATNLFYAARP
jgi:2-polyprenyl-3-methyl-5-hydroxy-6-metoxy-1,4-benzoquinol methylase